MRSVGSEQALPGEPSKPVLPRLAAHADRGHFARLALGALGVVYGDIGTSPLYAVRQCFLSQGGVAPSPENVLGILSLIFWSLLVVVVIKYLTFVMREDNHGEGGVLSLLALHEVRLGSGGSRARRLMVLLALGGAALLSGEGMITPAISVLSAVEGLEVAAPAIEPLVVPITLAVLVALFAVQRRGTGRIGAWFGPITLIWFASIAAAGLPWILREPRILAALNPAHALGFLAQGSLGPLLVLGSVVLCITGCEALFADMGHFGRRPIAVAWYAVAFPALLLNYFGQGALLLRHGAEAAANPFYGLLPPLLVFPMVAIATLATVVASQAIITGTFSLVRQAVQLGYLPRIAIVHTSSQTEGQIYVPAVNAGLAVACIALVLGFRSSAELGAAYGLAVTGAMSATTLLFLPLAWARLGLARAALLGGLFLGVDLAFLGASFSKVAEGGWFPLSVGLGLFAVMTTWKRGYDRLSRKLADSTLPLDLFINDVQRSKPLRVPGTAIFMSGYAGGVPTALGHHFKHTRVLHERVLLLTIMAEQVPFVAAQERVRIDDLGEGFVRITAHYGFMQTPTIEDVLWHCGAGGLSVTVDQASFFLGRVTVLPSARRRLMRWRERLFAFLHHTAQPATGFYAIPPGRVVELGMQVTL